MWLINEPITTLMGSWYPQCKGIHNYTCSRSSSGIWFTDYSNWWCKTLWLFAKRYWTEIFFSYISFKTSYSFLTILAETLRYSNPIWIVILILNLFISFIADVTKNEWLLTDYIWTIWFADTPQATDPNVFVFFEVSCISSPIKFRLLCWILSTFLC